MKSPITTHVLDTAIGRPAEGVRITLERVEGTASTELASGHTDADGRVSDLLAPGSLEAGTYRITFFVEDYLSRSGRTGFYPQVPVVFRIERTEWLVKQEHLRLDGERARKRNALLLAA